MQITPFFHSYPIELQESIDIICTSTLFPKLLQTIDLIDIRTDETGSAKAAWNWKERTIKVHPDLLSDSKVNQVAYLVFELFNAMQTQQFEKAIEEAVDVNSFVASFEKLEYVSSLSTQKILLELFAGEAESDFEYICPRFREHYALNQIQGHSEQIARAYFPSESYRGTLYHPLQKLDPIARDLLYCLLYSKITGKPVRIKGSIRAFNFEEIFSALQRHAGAKDSYQKALDCANHLFR